MKAALARRGSVVRSQSLTLAPKWRNVQSNRCRAGCLRIRGRLVILILAYDERRNSAKPVGSALSQARVVGLSKNVLLSAALYGAL